MNSATYHTYGKLNGRNRASCFLLSIILIPTGLVYLVAWIRALINNSPASVFFWYFLGCTVWSPFVFTFIAYLTPDITSSDEGLRTTFLFRTLLVKWEDIADVKPSKPFGLPIGKKASVVTAKNGLTFFHRIYGLTYGQTNQPALVIWSYGSTYEALIKEISKKRNQSSPLRKKHRR